jgi:hypothetical protein
MGRSYRIEMQIVTRLLLCFVSLTAFAATVCAQEPIALSNENIDWPSPDGKFAFLASYGEDLHTIDLIDKKSGKKLQRIGEEDSSQASWHLLWAPSSNRFALMTRLGHPIQGVDVIPEAAKLFERSNCLTYPMQISRKGSSTVKNSRMSPV